MAYFGKQGFRCTTYLALHELESIGDNNECKYMLPMLFLVLCRTLA